MNNKKLYIPKPQVEEEHLEIKREDIKIRKEWEVNPVEKVVPNKKKNNKEKFSNKGNLKRHIERELEDNEEEERD